MKKAIVYLFSLFVFGITTFANEPIKISKIESTNESGANFNLTVSFTANEDITSPWSIGFYMPRSFNKMNNEFTKVNADLKMSITDSNGKSEKLKYARSNSGLSLSAGYTTTLYPSKQFNLTKNSKYQIILGQNNQWAPSNYSAMPQNFYFIKDFNINKSPDKLDFVNIRTTPTDYIIGGYDNNTIADTINTNISTNLKNSKKKQ